MPQVLSGQVARTARKIRVLSERINNVTITFPNGKVFEEGSNKNTNVGKNTYRRLKSSIVFYNIKDKPFLALLSKKEYAFFVSCRLKTHVTSDGVEHKNVLYFCETEKMDGKAVGLDRLTPIKKSSFAKQVTKLLLTEIG